MSSLGFWCVTKVEGTKIIKDLIIHPTHIFVTKGNLPIHTFGWIINL